MTDQEESFYEQLDSLIHLMREPDGALAAQAMLGALRAKLFGVSDTPIAFGRYRVLRALGQGGMGVVYEAYDPELDRRVALKVVKNSWVGAELREGLMREARALARLSHPNVVTVHEVGAVADEMYIAMELVEGQDLASWQQQPRSLKATLDVYSQAGEGLLAAHRAGFAHGDFKPSNVVLGHDGRARVLDFGLARTAASKLNQEALSSALVGTAPLTETLLWGGTPAYMAPEQYRGEKASGATDQFSFCVALYEALHAEHPFGAGPALLENLRAGRVDVKRARKAVPAWLRRCLLRGLSASPDARYPSMAELLAALGRDPRRRYVKVALGISGSLILALAVGVPRYQERQRAQACAGFERELAGVWDDDLRARSQQAFHAIAKPYAAASYTRVESLLTDYAASWVRARRSQCELDQLRQRRDAGAEAVERCLNARLTELRVLGSAFSQATTTTVLRSVGAVSALTRVSSCDEAQLSAASVLSSNPTESSQRGALLQKFAEVSALGAVGKNADALKAAEAAVAQAEALRLPDLEAEAWHLLGETLVQQGQRPKALPFLQRAVLGAIRSGDQRVGVGAASSAMLVLADLGKQVDAQHYRELAAAFLDRNGRGGLEEARFHLHQCGFLSKQSDHLDEAERECQAANSLYQQTAGSASQLGGFALTNLAAVLLQAGRFEEAQARGAEAKAILEAVLGPSHPRVSDALANLGVAAVCAGNVSQGEAALQQGLDLQRQGGTPESVASCVLLAGMCQAAIYKQDYVQASVACQESSRLCVKVYNDAGYNVAETYTQSAELALRTGDAPRAAELARRALKEFSADEIAGTDAYWAESVLVRVFWLDPKQRSQATALASKILPRLRSGTAIDQQILLELRRSGVVPK